MKRVLRGVWFVVRFEPGRRDTHNAKRITVGPQARLAPTEVEP